MLVCYFLDLFFLIIRGKIRFYYILENLEVTLKTLEKKDFPNLDLNLLMFNYNFLKNNVYNVINNILQNHQNKESNKIINQWQQCIDTFLKEINKTFNHNLTFNINLNDLTITNLLDIENSYLSLNFSLNNIYKMLLNLVNEYLKCNFQISNDELMYNVEFYINEYRIFLMKKLEVKLSKIFNDFKGNISILLSDEYSQNQLEKINNSLKLTLK